MSEKNSTLLNGVGEPYSLDAEQAVLGAILKDPPCLYTVEDRVKSEYFYLPQHQSIFSTIVKIDALGGKIDPLIVLEELKKDGVYDDIGGKAYLMKLADSVPSTKNVSSYADIIIDKFYLRTLMAACSEVLDEANAQTTPTETLLDMAEQKIYDIRRGKTVSGPSKISDIIINEVFERLNGLNKEDPAVREQYLGFPTGFSLLDKYLAGGFHRSDLILLGARPGMGKTALALNMARNIAVSGRKVLFFSLEMSKEQLAQRVISTEARIVSQKLRTGQVNDADWEKMGTALQTLAKAELYFDDTTNITVPEMKARVQRMRDVDCVFIDYLQLMSGTKRNENRVNEVSEITRSLKIMAKDLNIPVITCSQLSRTAAKSDNHRPQLTDLRESGSIEQDADIVLMIHREDYYNNGPKNNEDPENVVANTGEIIIAKNRHGETQNVEVAWNPEFTMFSTLERIRDDR